MPKYEYECKDCSLSIDVHYGIQEDHLDHFCEGCKKKMTRTYNIGAITFKGNGWASKDGKSEISYNQSDNR
jgi:putative FmdB family regulatory protein